MIIRYRKKHLRTDFIVGSLYLMSVLPAIYFHSSSFQLIINFLFLVSGVFFLGSYYYKQKYQYLQIKNNVLTCFIFGSKNRSVDLRELSGIKKFTDEITFLTPHERLKISTKLIAKEDLPAFENFLASLDLEPGKNPLVKTSTSS